MSLKSHRKRFGVLGYLCTCYKIKPLDSCLRYICLFVCLLILLIYLFIYKRYLHIDIAIRIHIFSSYNNNSECLSWLVDYWHLLSIESPASIDQLSQLSRGNAPDCGASGPVFKSWLWQAKPSRAGSRFCWP